MPEADYDTLEADTEMTKAAEAETQRSDSTTSERVALEGVGRVRGRLVARAADGRVLAHDGRHASD